MKLALSFVVGLIIGVGGWYTYGMLTEETGGAASPAADGGALPLVTGEKIVALGRIEPAGGILAVSALPGSRLQTLGVSAGDQVAAGDELGSLDSAELRALEVKALDAQIAEAESRLAAETAVAETRLSKAQLGVQQAEDSQLDLEAQAAKVELLETTLALAEKNFTRVEDLSQELVSEQQKDQQQLTVAEQRASLKAARLTLDKMRQSAEFAKTAAAADLAAANAALQQVKASIPLESLRQQRAMAELQRAQSVLSAPIDGTVIKTFQRPGERIGNLPVLQIAQLQEMVVVAEVYQNDLKSISVGDSARVFSRAFHQPFDEEGLSGTVVHIGRSIAGAGLVNMDPFAKTDRDVAEVRVKLDPQSSEEAAHFINLQVEVVFPRK